MLQHGSQGWPSNARQKMHIQKSMVQKAYLPIIKPLEMHTHKVPVHVSTWISALLPKDLQKYAAHLNKELDD
jgi:hypothetical protein